MKQYILLFLILLIFWIINSGHFASMLFLLGISSALIVCGINMHMRRHDKSDLPSFMPSKKMPAYMVWITWHTILSNIHVVGRILRGASSIEPSVIKVKGLQKTDAGKTLFANSMNLTPGSLTIDVRGREFKVHALTKEIAEELERDEINIHVAALEE